MSTPNPTRQRSHGVLAALALVSGLASAQPLLDDNTQRLLVEAVSAAADVDLYNARCRSDQSGRRTNNLNKTLASKFRMTVLEVQDDLFPEGSYRRAQARLQEDFLARLKEAGGCAGAKEADMPAVLGERYNTLLRQIERLP
ncbi:MAG: hypothetical protein WAT23_20595 [Chromatiaceae bacterium]